MYDLALAFILTSSITMIIYLIVRGSSVGISRTFIDSATNEERKRGIQHALDFIQSEFYRRQGAIMDERNRFLLDPFLSKGERGKVTGLCHQLIEKNDKEFKKEYNKYIMKSEASDSDMVGKFELKS